MVRKGISLSWAGRFDESKELFEGLIEDKTQVNQEEREVVQDCLNILQKRMDLTLKKKQADIELSNANITAAIQTYEELLQDDPDYEIVYSNLALAELKNQNFKRTIELCNQVLEIIKKFRSITKTEPQPSASWHEFRIFLVKVLLRKAKALDSLQQYQEAYECVQ